MNRSSWFTTILAGALITATTRSSPAETYQSWVAEHFTPGQIAAGLAAPNHDHDGDSCPNILEYSGACLPDNADSSFDPVFQFDETIDEATVSFPFATDRTDIEYIILVSNDLDSWSPGAIFVCGGSSPTYHLNGHCYAKIGIRPKSGIMLDSDADGLSDYFEESLVASDPDDPFQHIGQIQPNDDFDGDGTLNIDEEDNAVAPTTFSKPALLDPNLVSCALDHALRPSPTILLVHTLLK